MNQIEPGLEQELARASGRYHAHPKAKTELGHAGRLRIKRAAETKDESTQATMLGCGLDYSHPCQYLGTGPIKMQNATRKMAPTGKLPSWLLLEIKEAVKMN